MALRACPCRAHHTQQIRAGPCAAAPSRQAEAEHLPPTRALLLQLSRFPAGLLQALQLPCDTSDAHAQQLQFALPQLTALLQRSASMRLRWDAAPPVPAATTGSSAAVAAEEAERCSSVALRLLGLSTLEHAAAAARRQEIQCTRQSAGLLVASPAAAYPPAFGKTARLELATNHLPLFLLAAARRNALQAADATRALVAHCNAPRFLQQQQDVVAAVGAGADAANTVGAHHSSIPLRDAAQRTAFIERTVQHVASRLGLRLTDDARFAGAAAAASTATAPSAAPSSAPSPPAHVLLLHLDAESLIGAAPSDAASAEEHGRAALAIVEQLLVALMVQLRSPRAVSASATTAAASTPYPPPAPSAAPIAPTQPFSLPVALPNAPLQAASQLLSSRLLCSQLLWTVVLDDEEHCAAVASSAAAAATAPAAADPAALMRLQLLASLQPVQSYRVQDGCISATPEQQWRSCAAFVYHADSTRIASGLDGVASGGSGSLSGAPMPPAPLHGTLNIIHLMRELLFKIGLGSKYGA